MLARTALALFVATVVVTLAASTTAVQVTISPNPVSTTFRVNEGFSQVFELKLDEPIICQGDAERECNVVIKLTNSHPEELALDSCHVKWLPHQWTESRFITVRAVEDFIDDGEKDFTIVTEPIDSASLYYNGFDLPDLSLETAPRPSAVCRATGDPHYRSFDGHAFHIYAPGRVIFYKSTVRRFEVQTDMYSFSRPAVHCAIAAREGNDIVVISLCEDGHTVRYRRSCGSTQCDSGSYPKVGITGSSNPRYVIQFASGARVDAQVNYWSAIRRRYINVYVTAPGVDYGNTVGVCGNNNGNPNDDMDIGYNRWIYNLDLLYESQRPTENLFSWYPSGISDDGPTLPPFAEECDYQDPPFVRPILNNPDVEDITGILKKSIPADEEDAEGIDFDGSVIAEQLPQEWTQQEAEAECNKLNAHPVAVRCLHLFPQFPMDAFLAQCVEDLIETGGDPDFLAVAVDALEDQCADFGNRDLDTWEKDEDGNPMEPDGELQTVLCPNGCSGHGQCVKSRCVCDEFFTSEDCSLDQRQPPSLDRADPPLCDTRGRFGCPAEISVLGEGFWKSAGLACRFNGDVVTEALFLSALEVRCRVPTVEQSGSNQVTQTIEVSMDGENWSEPSASFTWYDSVCQVCTAHGCEPNADACTIDGVCYLASQTNAADENICQTCQPAVSSSDWSFDYTNGAECGPKFTSTMYTGRIVGSASQGDELVTVDAMNPLVAGDASNTVTYSIRGTNHILAVDQAGRVTLTQDFEVTEDVLHNQAFESLVHVVATDSAGNSVEVPLYIELQLTNSQPLFAETQYVFTVAESAAVGSVVGRVTADDTNTDGDWGNVVYSWAHVEANTGGVFLVDPTTGDITVGAALDFESKAAYSMRLGARDGGGQSHSTDVVINIEDVNEAPEDMQLSPASVPENSDVGTAVGTVSVTDPDAGDEHTLALDAGDAANFALVGAELRTARVFDFENEEDRSLSVTVTATDKAGNAITRTFAVEVTNVNEAPTNLRLVDQPEGTTTILVPEAAPIDRAVADIDVDDVDSDIVGCTLTQTDGSNFVMQNRRIILVQALDYEADMEHMVEIVCADDQGAASQPLVITVQVVNNNDGAENVALTLVQDPLPENTATGTVIGAISAEDHDANSGPLSFSLPADVAGILSLGAPACQPENGVMKCSVAVTLESELNYEATQDGTFAFVVKVVDDQGMLNGVELVIPLENSNDPITGVAWANGGGSVYESAQPGDIVGELVVADDDLAQTYTVTLESHADVFEVVDSNSAEDQRRRRREAEQEQLSNPQAPSSGSANTNFAATIAVRDASSLTAGQTVSLSVSITDASDEPLTATFTIDIAVEKEPLSIRFEDGTHFAGVQENVAAGTVVGTFVLRGVPAGGNPSIAIVPSANTPTPFRISGDQLLVDGAIDYELHQAFHVDVSVSFPNLPSTAESIEQERFTVYVTNVDEPIVFTNIPDTPVLVNTDASVGSTVFRFAAVDPELHAVTFRLTHDDTNGLFRVTRDGALQLARMPSTTNTAHGVHGVEVEAVLQNDPSSAPAVKASLEVRLHDDCDGQTCSGRGRCVDGFRTFTCDCRFGFSGDVCERAQTTSTTTTTTSTTTTASTTSAPATDENGNPIVTNLGSQRDASASLASSTIAGIAVGIVALLVLVALVVVLVVRRRRTEDLYESSTKALQSVRAMDNPTFVAPQYGVQGEGGEAQYTYSMAFQPGMSNPLYAWYQPDYTRQETTNELLSAPQGSFIVRDSKATPGWHMIGVRTEEAVIHEKIRRTDDGFYELVPANNRPQPAFPDLPSLVGYYGSANSDAGFTLNVSSLDNPMYAQSSMGAASSSDYEAVGPTVWTRDAEAPVVPLKEREKQAVQQFASVDDGDLYCNTEEAKAALADA
ncbi:hypothetical protein PTSG_07827 [Salpingoeca rosetta]|uniref:Uncharacterized protein n=1 Tax=Salpingoeca rosetta (strain ATCC 50818 / BSB-021) TaxID=946362 RepID=F2UGG0_SALR5|nr:uncharacterized protein PTSG_07827 [Salpingoeca rosetta]EGD75710.1 hypothetical protein PTSG_07827 [Salpingoeca rosetta]|eukprot:XP_004991631.1 hypothetical protein PTSG_07827 [Salpingoeca rosetta]